MPATRSKTTLKRQRVAAASARRSYNSPLRQQQTVDTRARILATGAQMARELPTWDWSSVTFKAVGERANISERTVRRHFVSERALRDAIQQRNLQECGVDFDSMELSTFTDAAVQIQRFLSGFAPVPVESSDPGFTAMDAGRRASLLRAVGRATPSWSAADRALAAAMLDLFWNPVNFARFASGWQLDQESVIRLIRWGVGLVQDAIRNGRRP